VRFFVNSALKIQCHIVKNTLPQTAFTDFTLDLDGSFLSSNTNDSFSIPDAYFEAIGTRPAMPDFDYSSEYDPTIGKDSIFIFSFEAIYFLTLPGLGGASRPAA